MRPPPRTAALQRQDGSSFRKGLVRRASRKKGVPKSASEARSACPDAAGRAPTGKLGTRRHPAAADRSRSSCHSSERLFVTFGIGGRPKKAAARRDIRRAVTQRGRHRSSIRIRRKAALVRGATQAGGRPHHATLSRRPVRTVVAATASRRLSRVVTDVGGGL
jgi:hypothetical protein